MTGEVIKSFLVGLGFGVDDASLSKFNKAITSASLRVTALYATVKLAAAGILYGISKISEGFEQMGYEYRIIAPMINKTLLLRREMLKAYSAAGVNITKVIQQSVLLNFSLTKTRYAFKAIYESVAAKFFPLITKQSDIFRQKLYANMPKIQAALEKFVKFIFKAFEAVTTLSVRLWSILTRVYDFFAKLHDATEGWSTVILGIAAAWQVLNLSFLASPLGMILTGLLAILALYDDFKTFQEGGQSLFNWSSFIPVIEAMKTALSAVAGVLGGLVRAAYMLFDAFAKLFKLDFAGFFNSMGHFGDQLIATFGKLWEYLKGIVALRGAIGTWALGLFGNNAGNAATNISNAPGAPTAPSVTPVGSNIQNSQTNANVQQQTTISVQGVADANGAAKAIAGEQSRVNFDLVRNLRGATR